MRCTFSPTSSISKSQRLICQRQCMSFTRAFSSTPVASILKLEDKDNHRVRLSQMWVPSGGIAVAADEDSHAKLVRAGFLRQAHSGVFHMLPLGRRVQDKLELLIDRFMSQLVASKLSLSSISSENLWSKSGRLDTIGSELFRFKDRKNGRYILSPTHEEEITSLVSSAVTSYKELPIRVYQISRKYRDELRPRHGLLRSREFVMKDLYTFDYSAELALTTYHQVRYAYTRLFDELKLPYLVAEADSGDMGGNLSHEFHFPTSVGEDHVINCSKCKYVANEELAESALAREPVVGSASLSGDESYEPSQNELQVWRGISRDKKTLVNVWFSSPISTSSNDQTMAEVNINAVKKIFPDLDSSIRDISSLWAGSSSIAESSGANIQTSLPTNLVNLVDHRMSPLMRSSIVAVDQTLPFLPNSLVGSFSNLRMETLVAEPTTRRPLDLLRIRNGDLCPRCPNGVLNVQRAIELGHTFHLGTRYSEPLDASVAVPAQILRIEHAPEVDTSRPIEDQRVYFQMGCHGIGVTRMIGAVAETLSDDKGLNWPRVMAPFEVVIVAGKGNEEVSTTVYDVLGSGQSKQDNGLDLVIDDRKLPFAWKLRDADLIGYPIIVVIGRRWKLEQFVEVQCRRLQIRQELHIDALTAFVIPLLAKL